MSTHTSIIKELYSFLSFLFHLQNCHICWYEPEQIFLSYLNLASFSSLKHNTSSEMLVSFDGRNPYLLTYQAGVKISWKHLYIYLGRLSIFLLFINKWYSYFTFILRPTSTIPYQNYKCWSSLKKRRLRTRGNLFLKIDTGSRGLIQKHGEVSKNR